MEEQTRLVRNSCLHYYLTLAGLGTDGAAGLLQAAIDIIEANQAMAEPWAHSATTDGTTAAVTASGSQAVYDGMFRRWCDIWGDPDDPQVRARIEQTAAYLARG